ncbi:MAG: SDR family NAD(P)-dependent oxidoreductase, partial [Alcanivorax sp.]|nr:SDR family NAD(P)-dependent oxidoreductase [Alcanivorax sp.]
MGKKYDLNGKVALITGATGGIGAASARALYQQGASLVLTDLSRQTLDALAAEFDAERVLALPLDVTDGAASKAVVQQTVERFGRL